MFLYLYRLIRLIFLNQNFPQSVSSSDTDTYTLYKLGLVDTDTFGKMSDSFIETN